MANYAPRPYGYPAIGIFDIIEGMKKLKITLTGPDFLPKVGGLSTYTETIKEALIAIGSEVEILPWASLQIKNNLKHFEQQLSWADWIINTHSLFCYFIPDYHKKFSNKTINFIQGSELCFNSPNFFKALYKKIFKSKMLRPIEESVYNIFISQFTYQKILETGYRSDFSKDLFFYPPLRSLDSKAHNNSRNLINDKYNRMKDQGVSLIWPSRFAPHKNGHDVFVFCQLLSEISGLKVTLYLTTSYQSKIPEGSSFKCFFIDRDISLVDAYKKSHFNLIFSKDLFSQGFFEGFGLTALEAAQFGTPTLATPWGGQKEAVHANFTGQIINQINREEAQKWWDTLSCQFYLDLSKNCFEHTHHFHQKNKLENFLALLLNTSRDTSHEKNFLAI